MGEQVKDNANRVEDWFSLGHLPAFYADTPSRGYPSVQEATGGSDKQLNDFSHQKSSLPKTLDHTILGTLHFHGGGGIIRLSNLDKSKVVEESSWPMNRDTFLPKLPLIAEWIDTILAKHALDVRPVADFQFRRLPEFYSTELLARTKVVVLPKVPVPPLSAFGLPEFSEFERGVYQGITYKGTYFLQETESGKESLHFHELVHVVQWGYLGVDLFLLRYANGLLEHGYRNSPLELMAYDLQAYFDRRGQPVEVEGFVRGRIDALWNGAALELKLPPTTP